MRGCPSRAFPLERQKSNSNLLINSKTPRNRSNWFRGAWYLKTRVTAVSLAARVAFAPPSLWSLCVSDCHALKMLCMALCHALLFACTPLSARNAFTMVFTSSADLPETLVALVPCPWAVLVRTCALPRFDRVPRERASVSLATRFSV